MKFLLILFFSILLSSCSTSGVYSSDQIYKRLIKSDFINSGFASRHNERGSITVHKIELTDFDKDKFFQNSGIIFNTDEFIGYELINYSVSFNGSYFLENFQVFRICNKNGCKHKFADIGGIYS